MISGYRVSWAIYIAAKLGLADLLKEGSKPTEELAEATGTHAFGERKNVEGSIPHITNLFRLNQKES
jgi:hypothetical protein